MESGAQTGSALLLLGTSLVPLVTSGQRLDEAFYGRDAVTVARALLGQRLVRVHEGVRTAGIVVETEAYLGRVDPAAHSYRGRTARNASMWKAGGHAYVYFIYGMHFCMNVVAGDEDDPIAVLVRAIAPEEGLDVMRARRGARAVRDRDLCSGPGKLCSALAIDRALDGESLVTSEQLFIEKVRSRALPSRSIRVTPRIGVEYAKEWASAPLRFLIDSPHVSGR
jgi:DNA-3-methyladenine glycosylase